VAEAAAKISERPASLDELMLAMDVVDTIRHRELIVERELNSDDRRQELIGRLERLYAAQGIEVPASVLAEGVDALEHDRFAYRPPEPGLQTRLATLYVNRGRWGKPVLILLGFAALLWLAWLFLVVQPEARRMAALPADLQAKYEAVLASSDSERVGARAEDLLARGSAAIDRGDTAEAEAAIENLERLGDLVRGEYELRIVSRPGELSGVWRVPEANPDGRNYYLVVEAVAPDGTVLEMPVRNEETGQVENVRMWAVRVDEPTFERIAADKRDDGIIQDYVLAVKKPGVLEPEYRVSTTGEAITEW
jgi:hypothetical protein